MSDATPRLGLDYVLANQAQKHVTVNGGLWRLDALVQMRLESRSVASPPEDAAHGACWLMPAGGGVGDWAGFAAGVVVRRDAGIWIAVEAPVGALAFVADEGEAVLLTDDGWRALGLTLGAVGPLTQLGVGAEPDPDNPLTVAGAASLFDAGPEGDHRLVVNRATTDDTASVLFQTAYSGRAEFGLCGPHGFALRASPDGAAWRTLISTAPDGRVGVNVAAPEAVMHVVSEVTIVPAICVSAFSGGTAGANFTGSKARGTASAPTGVQSGDRLLAFYAQGWTSAGGVGGNAAAIQMLAAETFTPTTQGSAVTFETTPLGSTTRRAIVSFQSNGSVRLVPLSGAPSAPSAGEIYFDQTLASFRGWNGASWSTLG